MRLYKDIFIARSNSHKPYEFIPKSCSIIERNISVIIKLCLGLIYE